MLTGQILSQGFCVVDFSSSFSSFKIESIDNNNLNHAPLCFCPHDLLMDGWNRRDDYDDGLRADQTPFATSQGEDNVVAHKGAWIIAEIIPKCKTEEHVVSK